MTRRPSSRRAFSFSKAVAIWSLMVAEISIRPPGLSTRIWTSKASRVWRWTSIGASR
ncbi:hypothetical protein [Patulibacter brassicae]|uniref:hypothetical protein n=1 Tax=Patulibacter brassicae TaxID=1705717 RepID=UPI0029F548A6|nr:hypothetical protein [Patulibacter brassicae]